MEMARAVCIGGHERRSGYDNIRIRHTCHASSARSPARPHAPHARTMPALALTCTCTCTAAIARTRGMPPPPLHSCRHRTLNPRVPAPRRAKLHPRRLLGLRALGPHKCVQDNTPSLACDTLLRDPISRSVSSSTPRHLPITQQRMQLGW